MNRDIITSAELREKMRADFDSIGGDNCLARALGASASTASNMRPSPSSPQMTISLPWAMFSSPLHRRTA
ncbi:hypothetical protein ASD04_07095 [Devosia sp. Root436]|nr:hypothetical protein ASD04_07095 [Devosia sp. Root436]